jgi:ABC-2 type transport system permease protein
MIGSLAAREVRGIYATLTGWVSLAVAQSLLAWLMFSQLEIYRKILPELIRANNPLGITDLVITPTLSSTALLLVVLLPLLGMGSLADERRSGRMSLLLSSPLSPSALVLGKWLGLVLSMLPLLLLAAAMAIALGLGSALDAGRLAAAFLGLFLLTTMAAAITLLLSALNEQPLAAAVMSWGLLFLLWLLDAAGASSLGLFSLKTHLMPFLRGLVRSTDLVYFITITLASLGLAIHRLWRLRGGE